MQTIINYPHFHNLRRQLSSRAEQQIREQELHSKHPRYQGNRISEEPDKPALLKLKFYRQHT